MRYYVIFIILFFISSQPFAKDSEHTASIDYTVQIQKGEAIKEFENNLDEFNYELIQLAEDLRNNK